MNYNKLQYFLSQKIHTDIELVFSNKVYQVVMNANKIILASCCDYLKTFLSIKKIHNLK